MKNDKSGKWFEKSSLDGADAPEDKKQLSDKLGSFDGVLKFVDVGVPPLDDEIDEGANFKIPFTISTSSVDRDGDVISQDGWELDEYMKNPVILWAHDTSTPPVAKSSMVYVDPATSSLKSIAEFPAKDLYPFGNMVGRMYLHGFLRGASVGFLPVDYELDQKREGLMPTNFTRQRLLEWSAVPVPSNPEGLAQARGFGIDTAPMVSWAEKILDGEGRLMVPRDIVEKCWKDSSDRVGVFIVRKGEGLEVAEDQEPTPSIDEDDSEEGPSTEEQTEDLGTEERTEDLGSGEQQEDPDSESEEQDDDAEDAIEGDKSTSSAAEKTVIPYDPHTKAPEDDSWDGDAEIAKSTTDGLLEICTWYDSKDSDVKGSYKLPHHKAGSYEVVWRGVAAAMGALMGARGGVDIPDGDRKGVYNHLAKHYKQFGKEPPPFEKDAHQTIEKKENKLSSGGDLGDDTYEIPDLKTFHSMVREASRAEMNELHDLIGLLTEGDEK